MLIKYEKRDMHNNSQEKYKWLIAYEKIFNFPVVKYF